MCNRTLTFWEFSKKLRVRVFRILIGSFSEFSKFHITHTWHVSYYAQISCCVYISYEFHITHHIYITYHIYISFYIYLLYHVHSILHLKCSFHITYEICISRIRFILHIHIIISCRVRERDVETAVGIKSGMMYYRALLMHERSLLMHDRSLLKCTRSLLTSESARRWNGCWHHVRYDVW